MKKFFKITLFISLIFFLATLATFIYVLAITGKAKLDENKLIDLNKTVAFYDCNGDLITEEAGENSITNAKNLPTHLKNAFIAVEDKRFYKHNGIDLKGIVRASLNNFKNFSFKEGASTISQQLIKNTHLSSEKTLKRKLIEMKLAVELEKKYEKEEILEKYLNTIYFGDNCFGITEASMHYFSKSPENLDLNESAMLAGIVKAPSYYSPFVDLEKSNSRKNIVLKKMYEQKYISKNDYETYVKIDVRTNEFSKSNYNYLYLAKKEFDLFIEKAGFTSKKFKVHTYCDLNKQNELTNTIEDFSIDCDKSSIITDKNSNVIAYYSTCGEIYRPLGSTIKPLIYASAIENNVLDSCTLIVDEKTDFNGYSPSNYNDKYYGKISVKESLAKSSNVCAVKILNYTGVKNALSYLNKTDIPVTKNDVGLSIALGATEKGATLSQIVSSYGVFNNNGRYGKISCIDKITDENGNILYQNNKKQKQIFSEDTVSILNDMTRYAVTDGTAKKLSFNEQILYGKTGTVGTESGNTDAYCISYTDEYLAGLWLGNKDNALLDNSITGGTVPSQILNEIWKDFYKNKASSKTIKISNEVSEIYLDKISYEDGKLEIADDISPDRYKEKFLFKNNHKPNVTSSRFTMPLIENIEYSVNNNGISFRLCQAEYYNAKIFKVVNGEKVCVFNSIDKTDKQNFTDTDVRENSTYQYYVIPYFSSNGKEYYGEEITIEKIKTPSTELGENWWIDDYD